MSEPTPPDGHQPAEPPRIPERSAGEYVTGGGADDTPQRPQRPAAGPGDDRSTIERPAPGGVAPAASPPPAGPTGGPVPPPADPTVTFAAGAVAAGPGQQPPPPYPQAPPPPGPPPGAAGFPAAQPPGPSYGGAPTGPPTGGPPFGAPPDQDGGENKKRSGLLIGGLVALVVALVGALGFVVTQTGDDAEPETTDAPQDTDPEPETTVESTVPETTLPETTTTAIAVDGSVDGVFVHIEARGEVVADADLDSTLQRVGLAEGDNPVSTTDPVLNLCAAIPVESPVSARVLWTRDNATISEGVARIFSVPADGNCINNNGEPLADGSYEVGFTDDAGGESTVALFTVGAATRSQDFLNDTGIDLCTVDVGPTTAGFYQSFELTSGDALVDGETIIIDIADVEHEARGIDCDGNALDPVVFMPSDDPVSIASGDIIPPVTVPPETTPPPQITDNEVAAIDGEIGAFEAVIAPGSGEETQAFERLRSTEGRLPIASTDPTRTLCAAWNVPGPLEAEVVWEFNRTEIARFPVSTVDGGIGYCIPPGGELFNEGAYQVYLQRGDFISAVETFTQGRAETQLAFRNDTGVAICEVGFSPNLTNWYTFLPFSESSDFETALEPGDAFTIVAPFIENDIQARDCDGNVVAENFDIPPTDQTLNLSTGRP